MKKGVYYKDILEYIGMRLDYMQVYNTLFRKKQLSDKELQCWLYRIEQNQTRIDKWLNEEVQNEHSICNR